MAKVYGMYRKTKNDYRRDILKELTPLVEKRQGLCGEIVKMLFINYSTSELKNIAQILREGELEPVLTIIRK